MEPKIPTLKDSKKPQVKVRGLEAGVTLFDRLKQFKKKDLAFILAGLGTLFMAPLAEHFMMAPEGGDATLGAGMGRGGGKGNGIFDTGGNGSVGYDVSNGQAPGSAVGGGSDVITPLNVRDPSALVMGPGATQQPPTNSVAPATPPPTAPVTRSDSDLKDALAASARGVGGAAKAAKALLPVPKIALAGAGGLRGLGVANGGSSASSSLGPITSNGLVGSKAAVGGGLGGVKGGKDIKGVARSGTQSGGGLEALKAAANNAGDTMNRGAASTALDQTAAQAIPNGGGSFGGGGQGGAGANDKAESGNGGKDNKSTGESLEFLKQKAMQEKKIELWAKEQEAGDNKLELLKLRNSMAEAIAGKVGGAIGDAITCPMTKGFKKCYSPAADAGQYICASAKGGPRDQTVDGSLVGDCTDTQYWLNNDNVIYQCGTSAGPGGDKASGIKSKANPFAYDCISDGAKGKPSGATPANQNRSVDPNGPNSAAGGLTSPPASRMGGMCQSLLTLDNALRAGNPALKIPPNPNDEVLPFLSKGQKSGKFVVQIRDGLAQGTPQGDCAPVAPVGVAAPVYTSQSTAIRSLLGADAVSAADGGAAVPATTGALPGMTTAVTSYDPKALDKPVEAAGLALTNIETASQSLQVVDQAWTNGSKENAPQDESSGVLNRRLTELNAVEQRQAFKGIAAAYKKDEETLGVHKNVQTVLKDEVAGGVQKAAGKDKEGGTVKQVLDTNVGLDQLITKDLAGINAKEPNAFTVNRPNAGVVKDAGTGGGDVVKLTTDAKAALKKAQDDVRAYAKAIGASPAATDPKPGSADGALIAEGATEGEAPLTEAAAATPVSDEKKAQLKAAAQESLSALQKKYEAMWKSQAAAINSVTESTNKANRILTTGKDKK